MPQKSFTCRQKLHYFKSNCQEKLDFSSFKTLKLQQNKNILGFYFRKDIDLPHLVDDIVVPNPDFIKNNINMIF